jgi:DDE superfamily endonuclease
MRRYLSYARARCSSVYAASADDAPGSVFTAPYPRRTALNWADFLDHVNGWVDPAIERVYAILDNLSARRATDVLLFALAHPRFEFVFQPKYAAYLNLIEPWWKILRSLALKGRRFESCRRSVKPSPLRPPTGMPTAIPSSGGGAGAIGHDANRASLSRQPSHELGGCTT